MSVDLYSIPVQRLDGTPATLDTYRGRVLLIVNTASKCGLTPQYEALEALYKKYQQQGLVVLGFPSNDFAGQEPGTNEEIATFCSTQFDVSFPLFSKIKVVGPEKHPLYKALTTAQPLSSGAGKDAFAERLRKHGATNLEPEVLWNFEKFLVARDGTVIARFSPDTRPDAPELVEAITHELAK